MKCEYCSLEHNGTYGSGRFCSEQCARSFSSKKRLHIEKENLESLIGDKLSSRSIASYLKCSQTNVQYWLKKYGLKTKIMYRRGSLVPICNVCGETKPSKFYGRMKSKCSKCYNDEHNNNDNIVRNSIIDMLGGVCCRCGFSDRRALQIDHILGNGCEERRNNSARKLFYLIYHKIKEGSSDYQLLCANCNVIKRSENGENCHKNKFGVHSLVGKAVDS